jgi:hypothetical protein
MGFPVHRIPIANACEHCTWCEAVAPQVGLKSKIAALEMVQPSDGTLKVQDMVEGPCGLPAGIARL